MRSPASNGGGMVWLSCKYVMGCLVVGLFFLLCVSCAWGNSVCAWHCRCLTYVWCMVQLN